MYINIKIKIYRTVVLPVDFFGQEGVRLKCLRTGCRGENGGCGKLLVAGVRRKLHNECNNWYNLHNSRQKKLREVRMCRVLEHLTCMVKGKIVLTCSMKVCGGKIGMDVLILNIGTQWR